MEFRRLNAENLELQATATKLTKERASIVAKTQATADSLSKELAATKQECDLLKASQGRGVETSAAEATQPGSQDINETELDALVAKLQGNDAESARSAVREAVSSGRLRPY